MGTTIGGLTAIAAAVIETDIIEIEDDPGGTPLSAKVTVAELRQHLDNEKTIFGTGDDASIYYDATNLVINPKEAGSGVLNLLGDLTFGTSPTIDATTSLDIQVGSASRINIAASETVINDAAANEDFRIETVSSPNFILVNAAANGNIGSLGFGRDPQANRYLQIEPSGSITATSGTDFIYHHFGVGGVATSGTTSLVATLRIEEPNITVSSGSVTQSTALYLPGMANEATDDYAILGGTSPRIGATTSIIFAIDDTNEVSVTANGIEAAEAAGPAFLNETSSATNPTLIPDRTELGTGIGGTSNRVSLISLGAQMITANGTTSSSGGFEAISLLPPAYTAGNSATTRYQAIYGQAVTVTLAGTTQITTLNQGAGLNVPAVTYNQSGGAVTVDEVSTLHVPAISTGASVTITLNKMISTDVAACYLNSVGKWFCVGLSSTSYIGLMITDTDSTVEGDIWYDASEDKLKFKTAAGVETVTSA